MQIKDFTVNNNINEHIKARVRYNNYSIEKSLIIIFHGFKGFAEWGFLPYIAEKFASNNFIAVNIDFSLNGIINPEIPLYDTEKFAQNTITQQINDANLFIQHIIDNKNNYDFLSNWNGNIHLVGHSLGAAICILVAENFKEIEKIGLISPIAYLNRNTQRQIVHWLKKGYMEIKIPNTNQILKLNSSYIRDKESYSRDILLEKINKIKKQMLILHGSEDITVKPLEGKLLADASKNYSEFVIIENTGHTFGVSHPFKKDNPKLNKMFEQLMNFLN